MSTSDAEEVLPSTFTLALTARQTRWTSSLCRCSVDRRVFLFPQHTHPTFDTTLGVCPNNERIG